jgi:nucleoid DNA-binding protein
VPVPEKRLPFFKVGKELKELVNGGVPEDGVAESGE